MQSAIVEPDISLDGDGSDGESREKRDLSPVVVVRVETLWDDPLGEIGWVLVWRGRGVLEEGGERNGEGNVHLSGHARGSNSRGSKIVEEHDGEQV